MLILPAMPEDPRLPDMIAGLRLATINRTGNEAPPMAPIIDRAQRELRMLRSEERKAAARAKQDAWVRRARAENAATNSLEISA